MQIRPLRLWGLLALWFAGGAALGVVGSVSPRRAALRRAERAEQERDQARNDALALRARVLFHEQADSLRHRESDQVGAPPVPTLRGGLTLATRCVNFWFPASFGVKRELFDGRLEWEHDNAWGLLLGLGRDTEQWETLVYAIDVTGDAARLGDQVAAAQSLLEGFGGTPCYDDRHWVAESMATVSQQPDGASVVHDFGPTRATLARLRGVYVLGLEATGLEARTEALLPRG